MQIAAASINHLHQVLQSTVELGVLPRFAKFWLFFAVYMTRHAEHIIFQLDFQPTDVGAYLFLIGTCGSLLAGRCITAARTILSGDSEYGGFYEFAVCNVNAVRISVDRYLGNASPLIDDWCIDLHSTALHAVAHQHLGWLRPTRDAFGVSFAGCSLRKFHEIHEVINRDPAIRALVWPHSFRFVDNGDAWLLWQPRMLRPQCILPRPHDMTYSCMTFRVSPLSSASADIIRNPYSLVQRDGEEDCLVIRVRDFKFAWLLQLWFEQQLRIQQPSCQICYLRTFSSFIGNILGILRLAPSGNCL